MPFNTDQIIVKDFSALSLDELYDILRARNEVFVIEQNCHYLDTDGYDLKSIHVVVPFQGKLGAYCRVILPGVKYPEWSIGRVLTAGHARGHKLAHKLTKTALETIEKRGGGNVKISAQAYLQKFYESHGFVRTSDEYLDAGIPHIDMLRRA